MKNTRPMKSQRMTAHDVHLLCNLEGPSSQVNFEKKCDGRLLYKLWSGKASIPISFRTAMGSFLIYSLAQQFQLDARL